MSEDTDSSVDENLNLLKEAADTQFINDDMFKANKENKSELKPQMPSLRHKRQEEDFNELLTITPEARNFVAKKLCELLDKRLDKLLTNGQPKDNLDVKKVKSRVKLFHNSVCYIKQDKSKERANCKRKCVDDLSDDHDEKCRSIAVSGEEILNKKDMKYWSKRSKAEVFNYKKDRNGTLIEQPKEFK